VAIVHSFPVQCSFGLSNQVYYASFTSRNRQVARRLDFEILTDINCGYRGLEPGVPKL